MAPCCSPGRAATRWSIDRASTSLADPTVERTDIRVDGPLRRPDRRPRPARPRRAWARRPAEPRRCDRAGWRTPATGDSGRERRPTRWSSPSRARARRPRGCASSPADGDEIICRLRRLGPDHRPCGRQRPRPRRRARLAPPRPDLRPARHARLRRPRQHERLAGQRRAPSGSWSSARATGSRWATRRIIVEVAGDMPPDGRASCSSSGSSGCCSSPCSTCSSPASSARCCATCARPPASRARPSAASSSSSRRAASPSPGARSTSTPSRRSVAMSTTRSSIDDPFASSDHAVLTYRGRSWYVEDLGQHQRDVRQRPAGRPRCRRSASATRSRSARSGCGSSGPGPRDVGLLAVPARPVVRAPALPRVLGPIRPRARWTEATLAGPRGGRAARSAASRCASACTGTFAPRRRAAASAIYLGALGAGPRAPRSWPGGAPTRSCCRSSGMLGGISLLLMQRLPQGLVDAGARGHDARPRSRSSCSGSSSGSASRPTLGDRRSGPTPGCAATSTPGPRSGSPCCC